MPAKKAAKKTAKKTATPPRVTSKPSAKKTSRAKSPKSKSQPEKTPKVKKPRTIKPPKAKVSGSKVRNSSSFAKAESKAKEYAKDPKKLHKLFEDAAEKTKETPKGPFGETWAYLQAMIRLIRAYANGTYREIPGASLLMILVAVIYFVSPIDFIPDFIPVAGFIDDALVIALALKQVKADLDAFMAWELKTA
jgi:uncharacterized membrane protein YkvA (DUF1232 family)